MLWRCDSEYNQHNAEKLEENISRELRKDTIFNGGNTEESKLINNDKSNNYEN